MANPSKRVAENVPGDFFIDTTCIDCDTCRQIAPEVFGETAEYAFVHRQPETDHDRRRALKALICCPTGSIGCLGDADPKLDMADFPLLIEEPVYYCGFNSPKSYGGNSYFIRHLVILQPNYQTIVRMRLWFWEFVAWAGREWNLIQDAYWWAFDPMPLMSRKYGRMRQSVKMCIWLGPSNCHRNQENVLWLPSEAMFAESRQDYALRISPSGRSYRNGNFAAAAEERAGTTPFNLLPVAAGGTAGVSNGHPYGS